MIIDIDRLPKEGLKISKELEFFPESLVEENAVFLQTVHAELTVNKAGEEIFIIIFPSIFFGQGLQGAPQTHARGNIHKRQDHHLSQLCLLPLSHSF